MDGNILITFSVKLAEIVWDKANTVYNHVISYERHYSEKLSSLDEKLKKL